MSCVAVVDGVDAVISDVEMLEVLTGEVGTTFTLSCIRDKDGNKG